MNFFRGNDRLYVAIYPSGVENNEERKYHWAFIIGPNDERNQTTGMRYHVKNSVLNGWTYEAVKLGDVRATGSLLARIYIGDVKKKKQLVDIFENVPVVQHDENWRCRTWMKSVIEAIPNDGSIVSSDAVLNWDKIEAFGRIYVERKRLEGRYGAGTDALAAKPTWDLVAEREITP